MKVAIVVPNWNGRRWLPGLLASLRTQDRPADEIVVVDDASTDDSLAWLAAHAPEVRVVALTENVGFAAAANRGIAAAAGADAVALVNTDVELAPDWLARTVARLEADPAAAAVATKMVTLADPSVIDDAGDGLRRDGVCEQRGRGRTDDGRWDAPGEAFAACAGAALYRREAVVSAGGFEERFGAYLEDVDLGLRLRLGGWTCAYEPTVALHAGGGSAAGLSTGIGALAVRNSILIVARSFPRRWWGMVAYRHASWLLEAARQGRLRSHLGGVASGLRAAPSFARERGAQRRAAVVPIEVVVAARPWRGPGAGGHPESPE